LFEENVRGKPEQQKLNLFGMCLSIIVAGYLTGLLAVAYGGSEYYLTPLSDRAFHLDHSEFKPSGSIGHRLGTVGGVMMLLTFAYSIRKRVPFLQKIGTQKQWLQVHICLGLGGPALVVLHTTGKLGGLAAIGFYSTLAMVISGIFGRYLYSKIPRTRKGNEMSLIQIEQEFSELVTRLGSDREGGRLLDAVEAYLSQVKKQSLGLGQALLVAFWDDLKSPVRVIQAWRITSHQRAGLLVRIRTTRLILKQRRLLKKLTVIEASQRLFSYWHIFHRPFTILASVLISVHVAVATYFGYGVGL
jgi:hypothetical protein